MNKRKLYIRLASPMERILIDDFLRSHWHLDLKKIHQQVGINEDFLIYVFEGYFNEVYSVKSLFKHIVDKLQKRKRHPYALGLHLGRFKKNKFIPSLELGYLASKKTNACIIVNDEGERNFLYGKDILFKSIIDLKSSIWRGQVVIVLNKDEEYVGLGKALSNIVRENDKTINKQHAKIAVKNIIDLGWYLRRGG